MVDGADEKTQVGLPAPIHDGPDFASLVQIRGPNIGQRYTITDQKLTIGRDEANDIVLKDENVSRFHAEIQCEGSRISLLDKGSTNGSLVNHTETQNAVLRNGDLIQLGPFIFKFISSGNVEALYHEEIYRITITDGLTSVPNRRHLQEFLDREMARAKRYQRPLSLIVLDADHFKNINDTYGHIAGDYVLRLLSERIQENIRREELLARYGGEEFVVVMPESGLEQASQFAEKLRELVENTLFEFDGSVMPVTISLGVASWTPSVRSVDHFIQLADEALYQAKNQGRNRVCSYTK